MESVLKRSAVEFATRAGLSDSAMGSVKRYEGYLEESRAVLAFCDAARTEFRFTLQAIGKAVNRDHSTIHKNMKANPDGHHIDVYYDLAIKCIQGAIESM